jgi:hypothetical protein
MKHDEIIQRKNRAFRHGLVLVPQSRIIDVITSRQIIPDIGDQKINSHPRHVRAARRNVLQNR